MPTVSGCICVCVCVRARTRKGNAMADWLAPWARSEGPGQPPTCQSPGLQTQADPDTPKDARHQAGLLTNRCLAGHGEGGWGPACICIGLSIGLCELAPAQPLGRLPSTHLG